MGMVGTIFQLTGGALIVAGLVHVDVDWSVGRVLMAPPCWSVP